MKNTLLTFLIICFFCLTGTACFAQNAPDYIIPKNAEWHYKLGSQETDISLNQAFADVSDWKTGQAGFGYGDGDDMTSLPEMKGAYDKIYIQRSFNLSNIPEALYLYMNYDDGFIAYLNGVEASRGGISKRGDVGNHEASQVEIFELDTKHLTKGKNTLWIEGFNRTANSSDFSLSPSLATSPNLLYVISKDRARKDISYLRNRLLSQSSYLNVKPERDPIALLVELEGKLPDVMDVRTLGRVLSIVVAQINDGHSNVWVYDQRPRGRQYLPFSMVEVEGGIVAIDIKKNAFVDKKHMFLKSIDGIDIEEWITAAEKYRSNASPQLTRRRGIERVRYINVLRQDFELPISQTADVKFVDRVGNEKRKSVKLVEKRQFSPEIPKQKTGILEGNLGYLVIPEMDDDLIPEMIKSMKELKDTDGLIIDVRDNGGGRYGILRELVGYFVPEDHGPIVCNIAAYRLAPHFDSTHLEHRPTFTQDHSTWSVQEQAVIKTAFANFQPEWTPDPGKFSDWHFMLINRDSDRSSYHYFYNKPVIVLSNASSFSATDGFLGAFHLLPNVTIMGKASGGGSGRTQRFDLPESGIEISLSSMASFRVNGKLFDGNGVEVDVDIRPKAEDYIGKTDIVLEAAIQSLRQN